MPTLTQWTEIIGEYHTPVFLLTRPLKGLCFKCRASESRNITQLLLVKSPRYTGGDFMFLYRFVRRRRRRVRRRRRPQILVHAITFEQLFWFLSFLAPLLALAYRLTDNILVHFRRDLDLEFSRSNIELAISQPKMVGLPRSKKQTHRLNSRLQMWPLGLTLAMTLTLNFQGQILNWLYLSQKWSNCPPPPKKKANTSTEL